MPSKTVNLFIAIVATLLFGKAVAEDRPEAHSHHFAKDVDALHAVLAPLWHAPTGKERSRQVCAQTSRLGSLSREIRNNDVTPLLASIAALQTQCQTNPNDIDGAFANVHHAFHRLIEPGMH